MFIKKKVILFEIIICIFFITACNVTDSENNKKDKMDTVNLTSNTDKLETKIVKEIVLDSSLDEKYDLAYESFHSGNYSEAVNLCNEIIKKQYNHYKAYNIKGIALAFSDDFSLGMEAIDKSLELNPDYWYSRFNKALAYSYNKDFSEGLIWYDKSLELKEYCWSYYGKAAIYGQMSDVDNAVKNLEKAIDLNESVKNNAKEEADFYLVKDEETFKELIY